ncbi:MAG: hemoglobin/transferrin/lactoferrin receptor protein [Arenicella sp.]|jgi:hemoglobin/transferrin/lactoferrin receptor protein
MNIICRAVCGGLTVSCLTPLAAASEEFTLEEVTVYATSNMLPIFEYPGQVSVVGREAIDLFVPSSLSDLLRDVPGLEFSGGPRRTGETPSIRGRGGENVLVLLDGARQSFISAHDGRLFIEPELLNTVEVLKGPASALYGSGAVGGVLALETVDADNLLTNEQTAGLRLRLGYQDVNEESAVSLTGYYRQDNLDVIANLTLRSSGDIALGSGDSLPSKDDVTSGMFKAEYYLSPALAVSAAWLHFDNTAKEPNNGQGVNFGGGGDLNADVEKDIVTDTLRASFVYDPVEQDWLDAKITLYNTETEVKESEVASPRFTIRNIETTGVSVRNATTFDLVGSVHTLTIGGDWYKDEQIGRDSARANRARGGVPDGSSSFKGAFIQLESVIESPLGLPGELLVVPGLRYDEFKSKARGVSEEESADDAMSPRIGLSYGPVEWLRIFASYSDAFRAPSVNELYLDGTHFSLPHPILGQAGVFISNSFIPNVNLEPESSENLEVGFGFNLPEIFTSTDSLSLKASYYESDVEDLIDLTVDFSLPPACFAPPFLPCDAGTSSSKNVDRAEITGFELEARYEDELLLATINYSRVDGEDKNDGSDLGVLTPNRISLDLRWRLEALGATVGTRVQWADSFERQGINDDSGGFEVIEARDDYVVWDIYSSWTPSFAPDIRVDFSIENLGDENYERVFANVSEPGRNIKLALTWHNNF